MEQKELTKTSYNFMYRRNGDPIVNSAAVSFIIAIFVVGFGGALFSHSVSKVSVISEYPAKMGLESAIAFGIFQAIIGLCIAIVEWMEIRKHKWSGIHLVKGVCFMTLIFTFVSWIMIGNIIGTSSAKELESMKLMLICNCVIVCMCILVLPNYTMCVKPNESEENPDKIVVP